MRAWPSLPGVDALEVLDGVDRHKAAVLARDRHHELALEVVLEFFVPDGTVGVEQESYRLVGGSGYPVRFVGGGTARGALSDPLRPSDSCHSPSMPRETTS